jgi:acyl-coenzyme A synthetase/AMP-(fatty) acid ligase
MPMTKTGKILKQELREMHQQKADPEEKPSGPLLDIGKTK